jgi:8-oxo-dGTP diphosphatase
VTSAERVIRIAAYALCVDDSQRLLLVRIAPGYPEVGRWTLPGGGVEFGEDPARAVLRELGEETGLEGDIEELVGIDSRHYASTGTASGREIHAIRILYRVRIVGGVLRDEVDDSTDRVAWIHRAALDGLPLVDLVPATLPFAFAAGVDASRATATTAASRS